MRRNVDTGRVEAEAEAGAGIEVEVVEGVVLNATCVEEINGIDHAAEIEDETEEERRRNISIGIGRVKKGSVPQTT